MLQLHIEAGRRRCLQPSCALTAMKQRSALGSRLSSIVCACAGKPTGVEKYD